MCLLSVPTPKQPVGIMRSKAMAAMLTSVSLVEDACGSLGLGAEGGCSDEVLSWRSWWSSGGRELDSGVHPAQMNSMLSVPTEDHLGCCGWKQGGAGLYT